MRGLLAGGLTAPVLLAGCASSAKHRPGDLPGRGHDVTIHLPECAVAVIHGFLGRAEAPDLSCVANLTPPTFTVGQP